MRIDRRFLNWGVFFLLLGGIPLLAQATSLDTGVLARAWQLWPLIVIGGGIALLLRRTSFDWVGGLVIAATCGLMFGSLLAAGSNIGSFGQACGGGAGTAFASQQGTLGNGSVSVQFTCGDLTLGTAPGGGWSLSGSSDNGQAPTVEASAARLAIRSRTNVGLLGFGAHQAWTVSLPQDPTLDVDVQLSAGSGRLGLGGAHVGAFSLQTNAGSATADLSAVASLTRVDVTVNAGSAKVAFPAQTLTGSLEVNAGSIAFCVPDGTGLRITTSDNLTSSNNFGAQGLSHAGSTWETASYATAANRITLTTSANAGSLALNPKEGCR